MLCTFAQLSDLENCRSLQSKGSSGGENAVVFKAQKVNDGEVSAFYAVVITSADNGSADTALHAHFPAVDSATVQDAYKTQSSWGACFDALSDLQGAMESRRMMLNNAGFLLDSHCWPALTASADPKSLRSADWVISDIQSLSAALAQLGLQGGHTPESPLGSWEVLQHTASIDANTATAASASAASTAAPSNGARGTVRSYRNALLTAPAPSARSPEAEQSRKKLATAATAEWRRPAIVVQNLKYEHKDRLYQHNLVEKGIDPNAMYEQEDEDDGGGRELAVTSLFTLLFVLVFRLYCHSLRFIPVQVAGRSFSPPSMRRAPSASTARALPRCCAPPRWSARWRASPPRRASAWRRACPRSGLLHQAAPQPPTTTTVIENGQVAAPYSCSAPVPVLSARDSAASRSCARRRSACRQWAVYASFASIGDHSVDDIVPTFE